MSAVDAARGSPFGAHPSYQPRGYPGHGPADDAGADATGKVIDRDAELEFLRSRVSAMESQRNKDFWIWQGDGNDKLEGLGCHVLIHADKLREMARVFSTAEAQFIDRDKFVAYVNEHVNPPRADAHLPIAQGGLAAHLYDVLTSGRYREGKA